MHPNQRYHVPSGSYIINQSKPLTLEAYLGTCVGIALHDPEAGVGGLSHLLLPQPISMAGSFQPEKYASTGFPMFLKALFNAGARPHKIIARIAGGALMGPIQDSDLQLDIGGRTTEIVQKLLGEEGIRVEKSETGGFFTCCISLNMQNWECKIEPAGSQKLVEKKAMPAPSAAELNHAIEAVQPIPQVALKILRLIDEDEYDIKELSEEIRKDQVISARTLKLCNSVMFSGRNRIDSLDQALIYLGLDLLVKVVISASVSNFFVQSETGYSLCKGGLFHHAIGTAVIAEELARLTGCVKPGIAYTAGLLHDIGKVVLDQYITAGYPLFYRNLLENKNDFVTIEKEILGIDHTAIGNELAHNWSFPETLADAIKCHHQPENAEFNTELAHVVYLADLLMSRFHTGLELERLDTAPLAARLKVIGLSIGGFSEIVDIIPTKVFESSPELAIA